MIEIYKVANVPPVHENWIRGLYGRFGFTHEWVSNKFCITDLHFGALAQKNGTYEALEVCRQFEELCCDNGWTYLSNHISHSQILDKNSSDVFVWFDPSDPTHLILFMRDDDVAMRMKMAL